MPIAVPILKADSLRLFLFYSGNVKVLEKCCVIQNMLYICTQITTKKIKL